MAKRKRGFDNKKYEKWIKEGRGQGEGETYKPWLTIQDVPSKGVSSRVLGIKTKRQHDLLSHGESNYFNILEYAENVKDIREQFPLLPIEQTMQIADELNIKHPTDPTTQCPIVMTTDFLITIKTDNGNKYVARTIKNRSDLDKRQIEKFEIEKRYWYEKNVDWGIVTESEIDKTFAWNLEVCHPLYNLNDKDGFENMSQDQILKLVNDFKSILIGKQVSVRKKADTFEQRMVLKPGTAILIFKHLIITRQLFIDLTKKIDLDTYQEIDSFPINLV